ncbi:hypothetical protein PG988_000824 [Apiospora saccharicola]
MATSIHADTGQLSNEDHILQREAAYATTSEADSDYSTQQPTSSLSSAISSRSSLSAVGRIAQHIKTKAPSKQDTKASKSFDIAPDQKTLDRFATVQALIEVPLLKHLSISGTKQYSMSIRLMVLGPSRAEAKPYMVILALQEQCKRIQKFLRKSSVRRIYHPADDSNTPCFEFLVYGRPPEHKSGEGETVAYASFRDHDLSISPFTYCDTPITVTHGRPPEQKSGEGEIVVYAPFRDHDLSISPFTYCGTPITVKHISGHEIRATLGGVIKVDGENGVTRLYGLTVGHVMEVNDAERSLSSIDYENERPSGSWSDSESSSDSDTGTDYSGNLLIDADLLLPSKPSKEPLYEEPHIDPWSPIQSRRLGSIKRVFAKAPSRSENSPDEGPIRNLDWALIDMNNYAPNRLPSPSKTISLPTLDLKAQSPSEERDKKGKSIRATIISGSEGSKTGTISGLPSRLLLSPGTGFVDAMIINLDKHKEVVDGDSGSWVVNEETLELYGHVVAADAFGGGYIIPITDTMSDIRRYLNATSVSLPSVTDIVSGQASTRGRSDRSTAEDIKHQRRSPRALAEALRAKDEELAQANQQAAQLLTDNRQLTNERKTYQKEWQALCDEKHALQAHISALKVSHEELESEVDKLTTENHNLKRRQGTNIDVTSESDYPISGGLIKDLPIRSRTKRESKQQIPDKDKRSGLPTRKPYIEESYVGSSIKSDHTTDSGVSDIGSMSTIPTQYTSSSDRTSSSSSSAESRRLRRQDKSLKSVQDPLYEYSKWSAESHHSG